MEIDTDINEFKKFHETLVSGCPGYDPFYFRCQKNDKNPSVTMSWKKCNLTVDEAVEQMKDGFNIGIAGTDKDKLVIIDVDELDDFKDHVFKTTLKTISSSRQGNHYFYFTDDARCKVNISLSDSGEIRSMWQYVIASGSYAALSDSVNKDRVVTKSADQKFLEIDDCEKENAGKYTIVKNITPAWITYEDLPKIFTDALETRKLADKVKTEKRKNKPVRNISNNSNTSTLFSLEINDVIRMSEAGRHPSLFHDSHTGKNTSISKGLLHCWRHNVSHNAISALAVMAGLYDCVDAGTGHKYSNSGSSCIDYSDGKTIFEIWKYAKEQGYIPDDDPIPTNALVYFAMKNELCDPSNVQDGWKLPSKVYNIALDLLYIHGLKSGRGKMIERRKPRSLV